MLKKIWQTTLSALTWFQNNILYWPMRQIKDLWLRAVSTWYGHTFVVVGLGMTPGWWIGGNVGAAVGGWIGVSFYIARETLLWPLKTNKRSDIDRYMDAEAPFTVAWWILFFLLIG